MINGFQFFYSLIDLQLTFVIWANILISKMVNFDQIDCIETAPALPDGINKGVCVHRL